MKSVTKLNLQIITKVIEDKDGTLLKNEMINNVRFVTVKCNKDGNIWKASFSGINNTGQWCRECYKRGKIKQVDINEVNNFLDERGFKLLTQGEITFWTKIKIHCPEHNYTWETSYGFLIRGGNCKLCGHSAISFEAINKVIAENNAVFIKRIKGKVTVRNILLKCNIHDHEWKTNANDILKLDRWCYYCALEARKTSYSAIKAKVEGKGGILLTENCTGSLTKIMVRCANNHEFKTYFDNVNQGYWCPECPWVTQTKLHDIIKELYPNLKTHYNYRGFKWLKMNKKKRHNMEVDIWVPEIKLAIEYDGEQHFFPVKFSASISDEKAKKDFWDLKRRDNKKNKLISARPEIINYFLRFSYIDRIDKENIISVLNSNNIKI